MRLHYKTQGQGPPLVILHGLFGTLDNWQTLAKMWSADRSIISADLRNHGRSPHADEMNYPLMAEDVAELLESLDIHDCALLGHSMGGKVAMQVALSYPGLIRKLVVVDMAPRRYGRGHDEVFTALRALDPATLDDRREADELMRPFMADAGVRMFLLKNLVRRDGGGFRWRMNLEVLERDYETLGGPVGRPGQTFTEPTLFLRGGNSGYVKDEDWPHILQLFPSAELATVAGAGHWLHAEETEEVHELVEDFLGE